MKVTETKLKDVKLIEMDVFGDHRGLGMRMFFWTFFSNYIPVSSDIEEDLVLLKIT